MKNFQKGAASLAIVSVIVLIVAAGVYYLSRQTQTPPSAATSQPPASTVPTNTTSPTVPVAGTQPTVAMTTYTNMQLDLALQYPTSLNSMFASINAVQAFSNQSGAAIDINGCYVSPVFRGTERAGMGDSQIIVNGRAFCLSSYGSPGAGQLYTDYYYTMQRNGSYITLDYTVHTPNGCSAYMGTNNYQACQDVDANTVIVQPIQASVSTLVTMTPNPS